AFGKGRKTSWGGEMRLSSILLVASPSSPPLRGGLERLQGKDKDEKPLIESLRKALYFTLLIRSLFSLDYRNYIKQKFGTIQDHNAIPGEYMSLNQRYSNLIILNYHPSKEDRKHEITATGRKHVKIITERAKSSTSIKTLFNDDKQVVVLQGAAGIGKTTVVKKIMLDWASDNFYQDKFNYIFYISCREMNLYAESEKSSIGEIISKQCPSSHAAEVVIRNILKNERKLLFIIDGFDELRYSFDQSENYFCIDPWKKEPMRILLSSLFKKKLLPQSYLIITTRPTALETLHRCLEHPHYFEILGFSTKKREKYFQNFFQDKDQATQAFRFVEQNDTLFTMCVSPLVSWIICTVMKQEMERGKDVQKTPYTLTVIYMLYLSSLLKFHYKEAKQDVQRKLKNVCFLAAEGNWKQQILFKEEDGIDCIKMYSFVHLRFQEFFAALYYVLEEGDEQYSENLSKKLQTLLKRSATSSKVDFVFHFLFGFLNEKKQMRKMKKEFGWKISPKNKEFILHWVRNNIEEWKIYPHLQKELFNYLYETQDDNFVKNAVCGITEIHFQCNSDMELMILSYCIQHCQNLENLCSRRLKCGGGGFALLSQCAAAFKFLSESYSRHLAEVFRRNQRLKELQLWLSNPDDRAVELLLEGLQHPDCRIEKLGLDKEFITESCRKHLAVVLRKNQKLRELELNLKNTDDKIMEVLSEGLKHPKCKIETLHKHLEGILRKNQTLRELELTFKDTNDKTMEVLCEGLKHPKCKIEALKNQSLKELGLFFKNPDGKTMEVLCERLKQPECKIETVGLSVCLFDLSCLHLAEVLSKNHILRELELTLKSTDDKIIEVLCEGLQHPECKI
uniref:NACHT domain-containing protein n=1 Tax=Naja naja TaxID=35670 RepID=A0A8C6V9K9_NAJNA